MIAFWFVMWPILYTFSSSSAIVLYLISPIMLVLYLYDQSMFVRDPLTTQDIVDAFNYFDRDGDAKITYADLEVEDEEDGREKLTDVELDNLMRDLEREDGEITY